MFRALFRFVLAIGGASVAALLVALIEARAVSTAVVFGGQSAPPFLQLVLAELGVLLPVVLGIGALVGVAGIVLEPGDVKSPFDRFGELRAGSVLERLRNAALAPLVIFSVFIWCVGAAHLGRVVLAVGKPQEAGLTIGAVSVALLVGLLTVAVALFPLVRRALALGSEAVPQLLDPVLTGGLTLVAVLGLFGLGIATGDTGGSGGGLLGIFGVLKREELDLRPVANAAIFALFAYLGPIVFARPSPIDVRGKLRGRALLGVALTVVSVLVLGGLCAHAATSLDAQPLVARGLEKSAPLGKVSLAVLRRVTDRDKDGASSKFGGGDCNDHDPAVNPGAIDTPGNGIDEDCSGADTPAPVEAAPVEAKVAGASGKVTSPKAPRRAFNVILITVDTLRIDLGFLGYPKPTSPNLDKLAERSTVFERAYSMASYTGKSVGPMLIGKYPSETRRDGSHFNTYSASNTFVTERAHAAGFRTFAGHCHWYFRNPTGLNQGMDAWDTSAIPPGMGDNDTSITGDRMSDLALKMLAKPENVTPGVGANVGDAGAKDAGAGDARLTPLDAGADLARLGELADASAASLDAAADGGADEPGHFFAWFHFFDPHAQYVAHAGSPKFEGPYPAKNLYDEEVWFTDKNVGKILDYVASQPWGADTAIVVTADHGEAFADHGMSWHGAEIWESLVRVPLIVYVPDAKPVRVPVKRSQIDLAPTLIELMGLPLPEDPNELRGKSLLADVEAEGGEFEERDVFIDMPAGPYNGLRRAVITGPTPGMKLIHSGGSNYQLYDLESDAAEKKDLASDKERLQPVLQRLQAIRGGLKEIEVKPDVP